MLEQLLNDVNKVPAQSKSSLIRDMVSAAIVENAADSQKLAIIDIAKQDNLEFLVPSDWFDLIKAEVGAVIDYAPCNDIEDLIELILHSKIIYAGERGNMKYFDVSTINSSTYYEEDSKIHFQPNEDPKMLEILTYVLSLFDKSDAEAPMTEVIVHNDSTEVILNPDITPTISSLEKASRVDPQPRFDNLALPFGEQFLNVRPFLQFAQEKLASFGALLGALQDGTITINISKEYNLIIQPILDNLGLERISEYFLKDGSVIILCKRIGEPTEEEITINSILSIL